MGNMIKSSGFDLAPQNLNQAMELANMICRSQLAPNNYKNKPEDTLVAMMMGHELGLNPLQSIQNIAVINGKPSIYGDALMALVQNHPAFGGIKESFDESTMTATCTVWRKKGEPHTQTYSRGDAETAKLWGKQGPWQQYPKRMLAMRARGFALRNQFADALAGLVTREEAEDSAPEREINPGYSSAPAQQESRPALPEYTQEQFDQFSDKWAKGISAGKITPAAVIENIESTFVLPAEIATQINALGQEQVA